MINDYKYNEEKYNPKAKIIERNCLIITTILNINLAIIEIVFFFLTNSMSILFDGIFSSIMSLTSLFAIILTIFTTKNSFNYPFGRSVYDNVFALFKNLLVILVGLYFIVDSSITLYNLSNNIIQPEKFNNQKIYIAYISVACGMSLITLLIYFLFHKHLSYKSSILKSELLSTAVDFFISFSIGVALIVSTLFANNNLLIRDIVDKSLTIVLILIIIPPVIKSFVIEILNITGYRLFKDEEKELKIHLKFKEIDDVYIQRHNQQKIFMIKLKINSDTDILMIKSEILKHIYEHYSSDSKIYYLI